MELKVGQVVELINNKDMCAELGATAIVTHINSRYVVVVWKRDSKWHNQGDGGYFLQDFKPVIRKGEQLMFAFMNEVTYE